MSKSAPQRAARFFAGWRLVVVLLTGVAGVGCTEQYSAEPTFCDEWCRALRHPADCARNPASCVRDCELTKASGDCFPLQERLLACYQDLEQSEFLCLPSGTPGGGGGNRQRVAKTACRQERDALFECEAPGFGECLAICRGLQAVRGQAAGEVGGIVDFSDECPLDTQPCETTCWTAFQFSSDELERLLLPTGELPMMSGPEAPLADGGRGGNNGATDPIAALFAPCFVNPTTEDAGGSP